MILAIRCRYCRNARGVDQPQCHRCGVARVSRALLEPCVLPLTTSYAGLARAIDGFRPRVTAPWGWRYRREPTRMLWHLMPLWLYWLVVPWEARYRVFLLLKRLGVWIGREGDDLAQGHLRWPSWLQLAGWKVRGIVWCFLHDRDRSHYPGFSDRPLRIFHGYTPREWSWIRRDRSPLISGQWAVKNGLEVKGGWFSFAMLRRLDEQLRAVPKRRTP